MDKKLFEEIKEYCPWRIVSLPDNTKQYCEAIAEYCAMKRCAPYLFASKVVEKLVQGVSQ